MGQSPGSCHFPLLSQVRAPSLHRHYPASAVLRTHPPSAPTDALPRGVVLGHPGAARGRRSRLPLLHTRSCPRVLPSLPRRNPRVRFSLASPGAAAFPVIGAGRLPHWPFRGLLDVHSRCGPRGPLTLFRAFSQSASDHLSPPGPLQVLPAGARVCRPGIAPGDLVHLSKAHPMMRQERCAKTPSPSPKRSPARRRKKSATIWTRLS